MKKFIFIGSTAVFALFAILFTLGAEPKTRAEAERGADASHSRAEPLALAERPPVPLPIANAAGESNVTQILSEKIAKQLITKNPNGPLAANGAPTLNVTDPEAFVDEILSQELTNVSYEEFKPRVSIEELSVIPSSREASATFFSAFSETLMPYATMRIESFNAPGQLKPLVASADAVILKLFSVPVPADLAPLFTRELSLLKTERAIYAALARADEDPLGALIALQMRLPLTAEFNAIADEITVFMRDHKLNP